VENHILHAIEKSFIIVPDVDLLFNGFQPLPENHTRRHGGKQVLVRERAGVSGISPTTMVFGGAPAHTSHSSYSSHRSHAPNARRRIGGMGLMGPMRRMGPMERRRGNGMK